jgi:hypothetical protein
MEFLSIHHADPVFDHIFSDTPTLSRFLSGPPRFSIFCPWTPIQKCAELARLARKLEEPDDDELVPVPAQPAVPRRQRKRSLVKVCEAARKAGAHRVVVDGVVIELSPAVAAPEPTVTDPDANEWDAVLPGGDHGPSRFSSSTASAIVMAPWCITSASVAARAYACEASPARQNLCAPMRLRSATSSLS